LIHIPKGSLHAFKNISAGPCAFLTIYVPPGIEKMFEELGEPMIDRAAGPPLVVDPNRLRERGAAYGLEVPPASG
jgi:hypothetical protein